VTAGIGQDGLQASGTLTATTSAAVSQLFFNAGTSIGFRATSFQVVAATSGGCFVDVTGGAAVLATTSASYPLAPGERLTVPIEGSQPRRPGVYSGFSILGTAGVTSMVRWIALG